jgi:XTP/dITP diphosphohydrolase
VFKTLGCSGVLRLLEGNPNRGARFMSYVAYCESNSEPVCFSGVSEGTIAMEARGVGGFGFDPIFIPSGADTRTFAEMSRAEKGRHSHRAKAFRNLAEWLTASKT